ncbi:acetyl-CoA carboxylase carboxyltransferase subunit alpha [Micromonospora cathayae]|uniref:Multifunctional fusion protein n=1 Tax=Micromonospora cathayae TaxID=3028804 RepID=A0ABY7ZIQ1_9ACTN|nr:acetyl-CoA carboxylase carboxyltransferase subunit alpha [Micromonospora sp. HUAS 3]WDZ82152.1 acetyl-CoA carboxylase carboxyltransferase subunit alpha [Micromonospora sp. HUAS 3]
MTDTLPRVGAARTTDDWLACTRCRSLVYGKRLARTLWVCPDCGHHSPLTAWQRIDHLVDPGSVEVLPAVPAADDPLGFVDTRPYPDRLREARATTGLDEAVVCVRATVHDRPLVLAVMDFRFMAGSLSTAVGEAIVCAAERALADRVPLVLVTASGGARMQEGILSLLQMAKTSQALAELDAAGILTVSLITDPTYAGVAASFATLTDVIVAEPGARLGFTGPRVIEQTIGETLPEGFQSAEFMLAHGLIDDVRPRAELRATLARLLGATRRADLAPPRDPLIRDHDQLPDVDPWQTAQLARHPDRPTTLDYVAHLLDDFQPLRGDRMAGECPAIVGGLGVLEGTGVMLIGHQKGHTTHELIERNFGMPSPEGYRKAARLMRLAGKLGIPVVTLIDTPGAYPGVTAEQRGQAVAIAENLRLMSQLPVPIVAVVTGEGGSGGALALGVADRVLCFANTTYSVISPEGCAAILWRDRAMAPRAAQALRVDARQLLRMGVVDAVIPEPEGGTHTSAVTAAGLLRDALTTVLGDLLARPHEQLMTERHHRLRHAGSTTGTDPGRPA